MDKTKMEIMNMLYQAMVEHPYLRFGQVLVDVFRVDKYDPFYISDETFLKDLENFLHKEGV